MKQFQGYTGHHLRAMECLGLVDKDTVRNLTRDFQNIEVEMVVVVFSASSPSVVSLVTEPGSSVH
jgi:hypothetical protein